jgi:4-amino-4-deoxy-L-arabinose transferase-like glycosyltransferase
MFNADVGGQIAWLIPAALILLAGLIWYTRRAPRTDGRRASVLLWGGWLLLTGLTFSLAQGIFHAYYTVALAPAVGALVGIGATTFWEKRDELAPRAILAAAIASTAIWTFMLLGRSASFVPPLRVLVLLVGLVVAAAILSSGVVARAGAAIAAAGMFVAFAGTSAYSLQTVASVHTGAIPTAGPRVAGAGMFGPGGGRGFAAGPNGGPNGAGNGTAQGAPPDGALPPGMNGPQNGFPQNGFPQNGALPQTGNTQGARGGTNGFPGGGSIGGLLDTRVPSTELVELLQQNADAYTWAAATIGANSGAGAQLATGLPVMAIGGFNGTDPSPTLEQFQQIVREARVHYFLAGGGRGGPGRFGGPGGGASGTSNQISTWVQQNFTAKTVGGVTVYDLSSASSGIADTA